MFFFWTFHHAYCPVFITVDLIKGQTYCNEHLIAENKLLSLQILRKLWRKKMLGELLSWESEVGQQKFRHMHYSKKYFLSQKSHKWQKLMQLESINRLSIPSKSNLSVSLKTSIFFSSYSIVCDGFICKTFAKPYNLAKKNQACMLIFAFNFRFAVLMRSESNFGDFEAIVEIIGQEWNTNWFDSLLPSNCALNFLLGSAATSFYLASYIIHIRK